MVTELHSLISSKKFSFSRKEAVVRGANIENNGPDLTHRTGQTENGTRLVGDCTGLFWKIVYSQSDTEDG